MNCLWENSTALDFFTLTEDGSWLVFGTRRTKHAGCVLCKQCPIPAISSKNTTPLVCNPCPFVDNCIRGISRIFSNEGSSVAGPKLKMDDLCRNFASKSQNFPTKGGVRTHWTLPLDPPLCIIQAAGWITMKSTSLWYYLLERRYLHEIRVSFTLNQGGQYSIKWFSKSKHPCSIWQFLFSLLPVQPTAPTSGGGKITHE